MAHTLYAKIWGAHTVAARGDGQVLLAIELTLPAECEKSFDRCEKRPWLRCDREQLRDAWIARIVAE